MSGQDSTTPSPPPPQPSSSSSAAAAEPSTEASAAPAPEAPPPVPEYGIHKRIPFAQRTVPPHIVPSMDGCLPCKLTTALAFTGLGSYALVKGNNLLHRDRIIMNYGAFGFRFRQLLLASSAGFMIFIGIHRAVT